MHPHLAYPTGLGNVPSVTVNIEGATDNAFIERFFRTVKQKHVYLYPAKGGLVLYQGIDKFIIRYNKRRHQGIGRKKPVELYQQAMAA